MTEKRIVLDEGWAALDLTAENADLRAQSLGFCDADELKAWGEQAERERLAELASKKYTDQVKIDMPSADQFSRHQVHVGTTKDGMSGTSKQGAGE